MTKPHSSTERRRHASTTRWAWVLLLVAVSVGAYVVGPMGSFGGALRAGFVFDDVHLIEANTLLDRPGGALDGFRGDYYTSSETATSGEARALGYYRPIAVLSNWLDARIWHRRPFGFHLTNVLLHVGVVVGFFLLLSRLFPRREIALVAALLFAVHPAHTESVTFVSGRVDVLAAFFGVASLWLYVRAREARGAAMARWLGFSLVSFLLALLSKEMAITFPAVVFLIEVMASPRALWVTALRRTLPFVGVAALVLVARHLAIGSLASRAGAEGGFGATLARSATVVATYLGLLVWPPFRFNVEPTVHVPTSLTPGVVALALVPLGLLGCALHPKVRARFPALALGLLWMLVALVPVSQIVPVETLVGERYLYVPSLGGMLALGAWLVGLLGGASEAGRERAKRAPILWGVVAVLALAYGANTAHRNVYWRDNLTFWKAKAALTPGSAEPWSALGLEYTKVNDLENAAAAFQKSLAIDPNHLEALNNYALLLLGRGDSNGAIELGSRAIGRDPQFAEGLNTLATAFHSQGRFAEAVGQYKRAVRAKPNYRQAWVNLGNTYLTAGVPDSAIRSFKRAVALAPDPEIDLRIADCYALSGHADDAVRYLAERGALVHGTPEGLLIEGTLRAKSGDLEGARDAFLQATSMRPDDLAAWVELGQLLASMRRTDEARAAFEKVLAIDPNSSIAYNNLGVLSEETGDLEGALAAYQRARSIAPHDPAVLRNVGGVLVDLGRLDEAKPYLDEAVDGSRDPLALYYRGRVLEGMGQVEAAIVDYRNAVRLNPTFALAHRALGLALLHAGQRKEGLASLERFLAFAPEDDPRRAEAQSLVDGRSP